MTLRLSASLRAKRPDRMTQQHDPTHLHARRTDRHLGGWAVRSATAGSQDDVGDVWGAGWRVDARLDCVQLDREAVAEQPDEVVGAYVVGWVDASRLHVLAVVVVEVVVDGEHQPARSYHVEQRPYGRLAGGL